MRRVHIKTNPIGAVLCAPLPDGTLKGEVVAVHTCYQAAFKWGCWDMDVPTCNHSQQFYLLHTHRGSVLVGEHDSTPGWMTPPRPPLRPVVIPSSQPPKALWDLTQASNRRPRKYADPPQGREPITYTQQVTRKKSRLLRKHPGKRKPPIGVGGGL